jgi:hypothetical protein
VFERPNLEFQIAHDLGALMIAARLRQIAPPCRTLIVDEIGLHRAGILARVRETLPAEQVMMAEEIGAPIDAAVWAEPRRDGAAETAEGLASALAPGAPLLLIVGERLRSRLSEPQGAGTPLGGRAAAALLTRHGLRVVERVTLRGLNALAWTAVGALAAKIGRAAWEDRAHYAMRAGFAAPAWARALATLSVIRLERRA